MKYQAFTKETQTVITRLIVDEELLYCPPCMRKGRVIFYREPKSMTQHKKTCEHVRATKTLEGMSKPDEKIAWAGGCFELNVDDDDCLGWEQDD